MTEPAVKRHFVTFYSPGTFLAETTTLPIDAWSILRAQEMAATITERYNATPYAFQFTARGRGPDDLDSTEIARSGKFYLHARVETLAEIEARDDPDDRILIDNMRTNGWDRVVRKKEGATGWSWTQPLLAGDTVL